VTETRNLQTLTLANKQTMLANVPCAEVLRVENAKGCSQRAIAVQHHDHAHNSEQLDTGMSADELLVTDFENSRLKSQTIAACQTLRPPTAPSMPACLPACLVTCCQTPHAHALVSLLKPYHIIASFPRGQVAQLDLLCIIGRHCIACATREPTYSLAIALNLQSGNRTELTVWQSH
jgi:hypothetical protein